MRNFYSLILYCLVPFVFARLIFLGIKTPAYWSGWGERFGFLPNLAIERPVIWLHAVSVGEVEAAIPLVSRLLEQLPQYQIVLTTVTPTGAQTVQKRFSDSVVHLYLPYDLPVSIQRFINILKPAICIIMETEIWPNLYYYCHQQKIPVVLANARMSLKSIRGYRKFRRLFTETLDCVVQVITQSKLDADRFISLGCEPARISIAGNLKFDIDIQANLREQANTIRNNNFPDRPVWIAASTHENEEFLVLEAHKKILIQHKKCLLIIAPRHPQRFDKVAKLCIKRGFSLVRKSNNSICDDAVQVLLLDTLGELQLYYGCADLAFVGGSLVPAGGHNMLEPAILGIPIISGPHITNFQEITSLLETAEAVCMVRDTDELAEKVTLLLNDSKLRCLFGENARKMVIENRGGADTTIDIIKSIVD